MSTLVCETIDVFFEDFKHFLIKDASIKVFKFNPINYFELAHLTFKKYLDEDELKRFQRFHFEKDAFQFIVCRTILKFLLAKELNRNVSQIKILSDEHKKPYIGPKNTLHFNLSHTDNCALIAISNHEVGVDIEFINPRIDFADILSNSFNTDEIEFILGSRNKTKTFFKFWTRKEALVKAMGKGIDDNLPKIKVTDGFHLNQGLILRSDIDWRVLSFEVNLDYAAAIATNKLSDKAPQIHFYELPETAQILSQFFDIG